MDPYEILQVKLIASEWDYNGNYYINIWIYIVLDGTIIVLTYGT